MEVLLPCIITPANARLGRLMHVNALLRYPQPDREDPEIFAEDYPPTAPVEEWIRFPIAEALTRGRLRCRRCNQYLSSSLVGDQSAIWLVVQTF